MAYDSKEKQAAAARRYYLANTAKMKATAVLHSEKSKKIVWAFIAAFLMANPCGICGESDPDVLEFDHRDPAVKEFNIGDAVSRKFSLSRVQAEIEKCDVLCANCHRRKTMKQFGYRTKNVAA